MMIPILKKKSDYWDGNISGMGTLSVILSFCTILFYYSILYFVLAVLSVSKKCILLYFTLFLQNKLYLEELFIASYLIIEVGI